MDAGDGLGQGDGLQRCSRRKRVETGDGDAGPVTLRARARARGHLGPGDPQPSHLQSSTIASPFAFASAGEGKGSSCSASTHGTAAVVCGTGRTLTRADEDEAAGDADQRIARESALLDSCVCKTLNHKGQLSDVRRFPFRSWSMHRDLGKYGCSVAVRLLLISQQETIVVLVACFLLAIPSMLDNLQRSELRDRCRHNPTVLVDCGRLSDPATLLRSRELMPQQPHYLWYAMGACEEYSNATSLLQPVHTQPFPFEAVPTASFCARAHDSMHLELWCGTLATLVLTIFLLHLRRLQTRIVRDHDRRLWTTSDYAVLIEGLKQGEKPDDQERSLRSDLRKLGIGDHAVSHIEVGCGCRKEYELLQKISSLRVANQELTVAIRSSGRKAEQRAQDEAELEATRSKLDIERMRLAAVRDSLHFTTGQAFIVFQSEKQRNQFVCRFDPTYSEGINLLAKLAARTAPIAARRTARQAAEHGNGGDGEASDGDEIAIWRQRTRARPRQLASTARALSLGDVVRGIDRALDRALKGQVDDFADLACSDPDQELHVDIAPEPTDVLWQNLEVDRDERLRRICTTYAVSCLLVVTSAACFFSLTVLKANGPEWLGFGRSNTWAAWSFAQGLSAVTGLAIVGGNYLIKLYVYWATDGERHISRTAFERSLFTKLSLAFLANTVALPALTASIPFGLSQSWYEVGGPIDQAQFILLSGSVIKEFTKMTQPVAWFQRFVRGRFARSQLRLNSLWSPPEMLIGELFAEIVKSVGLCLLFAPLYPPLYLLTSLCLLLSFVGDKYAISYWWKNPPSLRHDLMERLRLEIWLLLPLHFIMSGVGNARAQHDFGFTSVALAPTVVSGAVWLGYPLALLVSGRVKWLQAHDPLELTTEGVRFDDVPRVKGYDVERFRGLAATRQEESADEMEERAFRSGLAGLKAKYGAVRRLAGSTAGSDCVAPSAFAEAFRPGALGEFGEFLHGVVLSAYKTVGGITAGAAATAVGLVSSPDDQPATAPAPAATMSDADDLERLKA